MAPVITKSRKSDEVERELHSHHFVGGSLNPSTQRIEESRDLAGEHGRDSNIAVELK